MSYLTVALAVAAFMVAFRRLKIAPAAGEAIAMTRRATAVMRSAELDEETKEREIQRASGALLGKFLVISLKAFVALALPMALLWLLDRAGLVDLDRIVPLFYAWEVVLATCLAFVAVWFVTRSGGARRAR